MPRDDQRHWRRAPRQREGRRRRPRGRPARRSAEDGRRVLGRGRDVTGGIGPVRAPPGPRDGRPPTPLLAAGLIAPAPSGGLPDVARSGPMAGPLPPYTLRRSPRSRRMRVTIDPALGVVVTVPPATRRGWAHPEPAIHRFLRERESWLRRHLEAMARQRAELDARGGLADGASIRYRGELHRLRIVDAGPGARRTTVARVGADAGDELVIRVAARDRRSVATVLEAWFRDRARSAIDAAIARHARALNVS